MKQKRSDSYLMTQWLVKIINDAEIKQQELLPHDAWVMLRDCLRGMDDFWRLVYSVDPVFMTFEQTCLAVQHLDAYIGIWIA